MSYFWSGNGGVPGDYSYGKMHIIAFAVLIVVSVTMCIIGSRLSQKNRRNVLVATAVFAVALEIFWRGVWIGRGLPMAELWPLFPCNLAGVLVPLIALSNNKTLKNIFYVFAFLGGVTTFVYPYDVFTNSVLNFDIFKSLLQHMLIIIIPAYEFFTGQFKPQFKKVWLSILAMFIHLFNSEYFTRLLGLDGDYIFLRSGIPFVIPCVPQAFILGTLGAIAIVAVYAVMDFKGFKAVLQRKNTGQKPKK
ncbi:MAG TPA: YwaF family protein [Clostridia bacterium]|nr:YwaF family protein [Clostridia bacterium]